MNEVSDLKATFEVTTITNGYLVTRMGRPSRTDPLGQRTLSRFAPAVSDIGVAVNDLLARE